jgi:YHS domain-containing protein
MIIKTLSVNTKVIFIVSVFALLTLISTQARAEGSEKKTSVNRDDSALVRVDSKYVCMVNDQYSNKEQIPVIVDGRTYYGCCEMCKNKLKTDVKSRVAVDPVSGKEVDKAVAVVGVTSDGRVYYFDNEMNLQKFKNSANQ